MKKNVGIILATLTITSCSRFTPMKYPETTKTAVTDTLFGTPVEDPYRWLEDDNAEATKQWVEAQNEVTGRYLGQLPGRDSIRARLTQLMNYPKVLPPSRESGRYFFFRNDGLQNQSVLYVSDSLGGKTEVLLDPNVLSADGTVSLSATELSPGGKYLAYMVSRSGSDWNEIFIKNTETGEILPEPIRWVKFSGLSWLGDGFFYSCYAPPKAGTERIGSNENHLVRFHRLGTDPSTDPLIISDPDHPKRTLNISLTDDKRFMLLYKTESTSGNSLAFRDLKNSNSHYIPLTESFESDFNVIGNLNDSLIVFTNYQAPNYRLLLIDTRKPEERDWKELVPEKEYVLASANMAGGKLILNYLKDASYHPWIYHYDGTPDRELPVPGLGSITGFSGKPEDREAFFGFSSYNTPLAVYRYDFDTQEARLLFRPEVKFNPDDYQVDQVFCKSKDGTKIPVFLLYRKGMVLNGKNPLLLYGYGGFNISQTPGFSVQRFFFAENGGIVAVANIRGGGEYGEEWHKAGTKLRKQHVFDDFIAAAEFLIDNKYTSPRKLAVMGGSNGGLLVGAVINQRPDLFRVALPAVGVMDMLRYHRFTIGWSWATDYGTSEESEEMFRYLYGYSPYHNISKGGKYPAVLVTTADHDDRVVPAHSFKYIARLQEYNKGKLPVLIRIDTKAGHGSGKPVTKIIDEYTDVWTFTFFHLGMKLLPR